MSERRREAIGESKVREEWGIEYGQLILIPG